jgi:AcrR family transcriptional regulator
MARTLNPREHGTRKNAFVDVALRLIATRGYDAFSVQDVLDEVGASKGGFYHYFDSKAELLDAVVDRMVQAVSMRIEPILSDSGLSAPEKIEALFGSLAQYKAEQKELVLGILEVWLSDANVAVRVRTHRLILGLLTTWLTQIIRQGIEEATFSAGDPGRIAEVVAELVQNASERAAELWVRRQAMAISFEHVVQTFAAYQVSLERLLGAEPGSVAFVDQRTLACWFGDDDVVASEPQRIENPGRQQP